MKFISNMSASVCTEKKHNYSYLQTYYCLNLPTSSSLSKDYKRLLILPTNVKNTEVYPLLIQLDPR